MKSSYRSGWLYLLECSNGTYYTGSTIDLNRRLKQHQASEGANYTKKFSPVRLVHAKPYALVAKTFQKDNQIQGWSHAKKKAYIEGRMEDLKELAECQNDSHCDNYKG